MTNKLKESPCSRIPSTFRKNACGGVFRHFIFEDGKVRSYCGEHMPHNVTAFNRSVVISEIFSDEELALVQVCMS